MSSDELELLPENLELVTAEIANEKLNEATKWVLESNDFISYATFLEVLLEKVNEIKGDVEKDKVLKELLKILKENPSITKGVGWDLPKRLFPFFLVESFDFKEGSGYLGAVPCIASLIDIFCELRSHGNLPELAVSCLELLGGDAMEKDKLGEHRPEFTSDRLWELKFACLWEIIMEAVITIKTDTILIAAVVGVLAASERIAGETTMRTVSFVIKRICMFLEKYDSQNEKQKKILLGFWSHSLAYMLRNCSLNWALRLTIQLKKGVAFDKNKSVRDEACAFTIYGDNLNASMSYLASFLSKLGYDIETEYQNLLKFSTGKTTSEKEVEENNDEEVKEDEVKKEVESEEENDDDSNILEISKQAVFLLATLGRFEDRENPNYLRMKISELITITKFFLFESDEGPSDGIFDALTFWAVWVTRRLSSNDIQNLVSDEDFVSYLQMLMFIASSTTDKHLYDLLFSLIARLLSLHTDSVRTEYMLDTMEFCPYPKIRAGTVQLLRTDLAKRTVESSLDKLTLSETSNKEKPSYLLTNEQIKRVSDATLSQLVVVDEQGILSEDMSVLLALLCALCQFKKDASTDDSLLQGRLINAAAQPIKEKEILETATEEEKTTFSTRKGHLESLLKELA